MDFDRNGTACEKLRIGKNRFKFDYSLITDIVVDDINHNDCPDYCDAFISDADYNGRPMTEEEIEFLNEDTDFVYESIIAQLY